MSGLFSFLFLTAITSFHFQNGLAKYYYNPVTQGTTPEPFYVQTVSEFEQIIYNNLTSNKVSRASRPRRGFHEVTDVSISIEVLNMMVNSLGDNLYNWDVHLTLRESWTDYRLKYDTSNHPDYPYFRLMSTKPVIWTPDLYFPESVRFPVLSDKDTNGDTLTRVSPNGEVLHSFRALVTLPCAVVENGYPKRLECPLILSSFGYSMDELKLKWEEERPIEARPSAKKDIPNFNFDKVVTGRLVATRKIDSFSTVYARFTFTEKEVPSFFKY